MNYWNSFSFLSGEGVILRGLYVCDSEVEARLMIDRVLQPDIPAHFGPVRPSAARMVARDYRLAHHRSRVIPQFLPYSREA